MILNKIFHKLKKRLGILSSTQRANKRRIKALRRHRLSDLTRWIKNEELQTEWNFRSILLADHVPQGSDVIEFGAATGMLESYLKNKATYQGADIVARKESFLVCDLNVQPMTIDLSNYDTVILSGVLEYVYDISYVLKYFFDQNIKKVFFSYACSDLCKQDRFLNGWLSDFSLPQILSQIIESGFIVENTLDWKDQKLFICNRIEL